MVQAKNADELFQNFIWHTRAVDAGGIKRGDLSEKVPVGSEKAKADGDEGLHLHPRNVFNAYVVTKQRLSTFAPFSHSSLRIPKFESSSRTSLSLGVTSSPKAH